MTCADLRVWQADALQFIPAHYPLTENTRSLHAELGVLDEIIKDGRKDATSNCVVFI